jgi:hypothetical protein
LSLAARNLGREVRIHAACGTVEQSESESAVFEMNRWEGRKRLEENEEKKPTSCKMRSAVWSVYSGRRRGMETQSGEEERQMNEEGAYK